MATRNLQANPHNMTTLHDLRVYLLKVERLPGRWVFYAEEPDGVGEPAPRHDGLRGWAEAKLHAVKDRWQHSQGQAVRLSRRVWEWLHSRTHPDERLLALLRSARVIEVHYPASLPVGTVSEAWSSFRGGAWRRHWAWFLVNVLLAPFSILLIPLPGPNVVGFWLTYRAVHHGLILVDRVPSERPARRAGLAR